MVQATLFGKYLVDNFNKLGTYFEHPQRAVLSIKIFTGVCMLFAILACLRYEVEKTQIIDDAKT